MPKHLVWTHRGKLLVVWNPNVRWDYWNFGDINPESGVWVSRGRVKGRDAAKQAAEEYIDGVDPPTARKK
jgi:hypothetical protein